MDVDMLLQHTPKWLYNATPHVVGSVYGTAQIRHGDRLVHTHAHVSVYEPDPETCVHVCVRTCTHMSWGQVKVHTLCPYTSMGLRGGVVRNEGWGGTRAPYDKGGDIRSGT